MTPWDVYVRPAIRAMAGYTPGEQPQTGGILKLNTNENPYPPSPLAIEAVRRLLDDPSAERLRRYPEPLGDRFRQTAARVLGVKPGNILVGNGSDDILTILTRTLVPEGGRVLAMEPSYLLYSTLASLQGATLEEVPFAPGWDLPLPWPKPGANLVFLPNPNSPSGTLVGLTRIRQILPQLQAPLVLDEAYVDFAPCSGLELVQDGLPVVVTRSLSKGYALAGLRFGFAVADEALVCELEKMKDSYNCDALALVAAEAALADQQWLADTRAKVIASRVVLEQGLAGLGFTITPSQANFVWCRHPHHAAHKMFEALKARNIFIRLMRYPGHADGIRITVGTPEGTGRVLEALGDWLRHGQVS